MRFVISRRTTGHQKFVQTTKRLLTGSLAYADDYPVGSWMRGYARPDLFIVQRSSIGMRHLKKKKAWIGTYGRFFIIECKVSLDDVPNGLFQLLIALVSIGDLQDLDFHHGGLGPTLAISSRLRENMERKGLLKELQEIFAELSFGLVIVDTKNESVEWILHPGSFLG